MRYATLCVSAFAMCVGLCDSYNFYGPSGGYAGSAYTTNGYTNFYGPSGQYEGSASTSPQGYTNFYNSDGGYAGSMTGGSND